MEFLKNIFGDKALTFADFTAAVEADKSIKLVNLKDDGYVAKNKLTDKIAELQAANDTITDLKGKLQNAEKVDVEALQKKITDYEQAEQTRKQEETAAKELQALKERFAPLKGEHKYINEYTENAMFDEFKNALSLDENKSIFPDEVEKLYKEVSKNESASDELVGEFALKVETYAPRAAIMGDIVGKTFGAETETELADAEVTNADTATDTGINANESVTGTNIGDSVFTERSAQKPEYDMIKDGLNYGTGKVRLSQDHLKVASTGRALGHKVVFENTQKTQGFKSDGYIETDGTIHIDYNCKNPVEFVLKHELTHFGEDTEEYKSFVKEVKNSKAYEQWINKKVGGVEKPEIKSAIYRKRIMDNYAANGVKLTPTQAEAELIADFSGEVLFRADGSGLKSIMSDMSNSRRSKFANFFRNFITYLKAKLTHNKTISAEVLKLEQLFNKALSAAEQKNNTTEGDVKYSIAYTTDNKPVAIIEEDILDGVPKSDWVKTVKETISEKFSDGIPISGRLIKINSITKNEYVNSKNTQYLRATDGTIYANKFKSANNLDDIMLASTNYINEDLKHSRKDNFKEFARGDVLIRVGNNDYSAKVIVGFTSGNQMVLYDVVDFIPTEFSIKKERTHQGYAEAGSPRKDVSSTSSISDTTDFVNENISETDSEGNKLSSEQQKYFANSKVRSKDGNLLVMCHGTKTENGDFYVFDSSKAVKKGGLGLKALGKGNYFTSKKLNGTERFGSRVIEAYLNITNPFVYDGANGDIVSLAQQVEKDTGISTEGMTADELQNKMRELGYDGVIEYRRDGSLGIAVAFDSEQIKEIGNTSPTSNPDIRYSIPDRQSELLGKYEKGEITREEYLREINKNREEAVNTYGAFKEGENAKVKIPVPKAVREGKNTAQFTDSYHLRSHC